jgi:membrane-associated phospholipid phosphatase
VAPLLLLAIVAALLVAALTYVASTVAHQRLAGTLAVRRIGAARSHLVTDLTRPGAYVVLLATALGLTGAVGWVVGVAARNAQSADWTVFHWFAQRQYHSMTTLMDQVTKMGNRSEIKALIVLAAIAFVVKDRKRAWLPILAVVVTFAAEHFLQRMLGLTIHRGHPPTDAGTFPSGGCARLISMYGIVFYCLVANTPITAWAKRAGFAVIAGLGTMEAFSRVVLQKHWLSDTIGGLVFGAVLLATMIFAVEALGLSRRRGQRRPADALPEQRERAGSASVTAG